jgi:hypothetical protein
VAGIINSIVTRFSSVGADSVVNDSTRIGRAQTRLGQASASAGRTFSAQASGLGGLVAAYAGAAATTFALSAAFDALARSARAAQTIQGLNILAAEVGLSGQALLQNVRDITKAQLTIAETAQQLSLSLSAGFNEEQIEGLSVVALKASRALGRDLNDAYTRVVRGSAKLETELLDELGIYTKIDPATRAYAAAIGKSVTELTEFERRQAFVNSVIEEGTRKFSGINTTIPTAAEQIEAFGTKIQDLTTQLGILLAEALAPLAAFLTNNLAGAFSVLGIAISLVAEKSIQLLSASFKAITASIISAGLQSENFVRQLTGIQKTATSATLAITSVDKSTLRLNDVEKARIDVLQNTAAARNLSNSEIKESNALIRKSITALNVEKTAELARRDAALAALNASGANVKLRDDEFKAARRNLQLLQQQGANTAALTAAQRQLASAQGRLGAASAAFNRAQSANLDTLNSARTAVLGLSADIARLNTVLGATVPAAAGARAAIAGFLAFSARAIAGFAAGFTALFTGIVAAASKLFFVVSLFTLIGSSIAGALGKGQEFEGLISGIGNTFKGIFTDENAKNIKNAIQGISAANFDQLEKADQQLKNLDKFTFKKKFLFFDIEVTKTKDQLVSEVNSLITEVLTGTEKSLADSSTSGAALAGAIVGNIAAGLVRFIPGIGPVVGAAFGSTIGRAVGTAVGGIAGTIWDYFSDVPEVPLQVRNAIKNEFAAALTGIDDSVQDKLATVIASLRDRYGEAAKVDPAARVALKTQEQLVLASASYLENIEAVAGIMIATGQTADIIAKNFTFDEAVDGINYISKAVTDIAGTRFEFQFIDVNDQSLQKAISLPEQALENYADGFGTILQIIRDTKKEGESTLDVIRRLEFGQGLSQEQVTLLNTYGEALNIVIGTAESGVAGIRQLENALSGAATLSGFVDVRDNFLELVGSINLFQESALRSGEVLRTLNDGIQNGSLDVERFSQQFTNFSTALLVAERQFGQTQAAIATLRSKISTEQDPARRAALESELVTLTAIRDNVFQQLNGQRELLGVLEAQGEAIKSQEQLSKFFKSFEVKDFDAITLDIDLRLAGLSDLEKFIGTIAILKEGVEAAQSNLDTYADVSERLSKLNILPNEVQAILTNGDKNLAALAKRLDSIKGVTATIGQTSGEAILEITTGFAEAGNQVSAFISAAELASAATVSFGIASKQAIENFVKKSFQQIPGLVDEATKSITSLKEKIATELEELSFQSYELDLQARLDTAAFESDLNLLRAKAQLERLELQVELVGAQVSAKDISPVEGAKRENSLQREILAQRERILNLEFAQAIQALERRRTEAELAASRERQLIAADIEAQRQKVVSDQAYINAIINAYTAIFTENKNINNDLLTGLVTNGNVVADTLAEVFRTGATALATAIATAITTQTVAVSAVSGGTGQAVVNTGAVQITSQTLDSYNSAVEGILSGLEELEAKRLEVVDQGLNNAIANIENEITLESERHNNAVANLLTEGQIEDFRSKERIASAEKEGKAASKEIKNRLKDIADSFKSTIESAFMSLNNYILYGEGNLADIFVQLLQNIQREVLNKVIFEPLSDLFANQLKSFIGKLFPTDILGDPLSGPLGGLDESTATSALGQSIASAGSNAASLILSTGQQLSGALSQLGVSVQSGASGAASSSQAAGAQLQPALTGLGTSAQTAAAQAGAQTRLAGTQLSTSVQTTGTTIQTGTAAASAGVQAAGTTFTAALSAFWPILLLLGLTTLISRKAAGGIIQKAAGGYIQQLAGSGAQQLAGGGMLRDRVPALLEPGEFVIRRPIARAVGVPALQALNATGQMSGESSAPVINIINEGTAKEAQASTPRFDGERYVIDIVTRDLQNNGPIRRSLRGGL